MTDKNILLTPAGLKKLKDELTHLKKVSRKEVAQKIKEAKEQGDLSENAEYAAAKEEQGQIESRISELEHTIKVAEVKDPSTNESDVVELGDTIIVGINGDQKEFEIVGTNEADPINGKISNESPLGKGLLGAKVGEEVDCPTPNGVTRCTIKEIK